MAGITQLDTGLEQATARKSAGDVMTNRGEERIATVDTAGEATLGLMLKVNTEITTDETEFQVRSGMPDKLSKLTKKAAGEVKSNQ
jgi:hypothetical protein